LIARSIKGNYFKGLLAYLLSVGRDLPAEAIRIFNLGSLRTAVAEMRANASRSNRIQHAVGHLILAFSAAERPEPDVRAAMAERFLEVLGLAAHQVVMVDHSLEPTHLRTDRHGELHMMVSRIGVDGRVAKSLDSFDFATCERAAAQVSLEFGLTPVPGRFNTLSGERYGPALAVRSPDAPEPISETARGLKAATGDDVLIEELRADDGLRSAIIEARQRSDWVAFEEAFFSRGYRLAFAARTKGRKPALSCGMIVLDRDNPDRRCALSKIGRAASEKWGLPSIVGRKGSIDGFVFPAMGPPPPGLIYEAPRRQRGQPAAPELPPMRAEIARRAKKQNRISGGFDREKAYQAFKKELSEAKAHNARIETDRRAEHALIHQAADEEFQAIVAMAKRRRKLVRGFFGYRSPIAALWNALADLAVDAKLGKLKAIKSRLRNEIDVRMRHRRRQLPLLSDFMRAAHTASTANIEAEAPTRPVSTVAPNLDAITAEQARPESSSIEKGEKPSKEKNPQTQTTYEAIKKEGINYDNVTIHTTGQRSATEHSAANSQRGHPSARILGASRPELPEAVGTDDPGKRSSGSPERLDGYSQGDSRRQRPDHQHARLHQPAERGEPRADQNAIGRAFAQRQFVIARLKHWAIDNTAALGDALENARASFVQPGAGSGGPSAVIAPTMLAIARLRAWSARHQVALADFFDPVSAPPASPTAMPPKSVVNIVGGGLDPSKTNTQHIQSDLLAKSARTPPANKPTIQLAGGVPTARDASLRSGRTTASPIAETIPKSSELLVTETETSVSGDAGRKPPKDRFVPKSDHVQEKPSDKPNPTGEFDPNSLPTPHLRRLASTMITTHNEKVFGMAADCFQFAQKSKFADRAANIAGLKRWARAHPDRAKEFCADFPYFTYRDLNYLHDKLKSR
jgi:hypothetical protein